MILFKNFFNNTFYFWLLGLSFVFISYIAIYNTLVISNSLGSSNESEIAINSKYSLSLLKQGLSIQYLLIPINFIKLFAYFLIGQSISIYFINLVYRINFDSKFIIFITFLIGCYINYFLVKLL